MPICRGGGEGDISLRNASFPQLFRATVRNNQIDILLHEINRKTAALAGFEVTLSHDLKTRKERGRIGTRLYLLQLELRSFRKYEDGVKFHWAKSNNFSREYRIS